MTVFEGEYSVASVIPVEVYPPVTSIDCPAPEFVYPGENCRLVPVALPERARYRDVEITLLSGPAVLGEDGYAEFTGVGTAVFSLSAVDMSVTLEIPVVPYPTGLAFEEDSFKVAIGGSIAPYPTVYPEGSRIRLTVSGLRPSLQAHEGRKLFLPHEQIPGLADRLYRDPS